MNPLPRLLALGLLVLLAALAVVLAMPVWRGASPGPLPAVQADARAATKPLATPRAVRLVQFSERIALPLALTALVLATALLVSLSLRSPASTDTPTPFAARTEVGTLTRLAQKSAAQGEALSHERLGRERAEENASLQQQLLDRSLEERTRLGRDLHDGLIQSLYAAGLTIESARALVPRDPAEADRRLEQARQTLNHAIKDVRTHIAGLRPEQLRETTFTGAVEALVAELGAGRSVHFDRHIDEAAAARLSAAQQMEALHIVREAISNALRHGGATVITLRVHAGDGAAALLIQDNGRGFDPSRAPGSGHGRPNMQARATAAGGSLRLESQPGSGTRVVLTLPFVSKV